MSPRCLSSLSALDREGYSKAALRRLTGGRNLGVFLSITRADIPGIQAQTAGRLSISGVQDKISLRLHRGKLEVTQTGGEYILKPVPGTRLPKFHDDLPANEHLTMQLAEQVFGVRTAANGLVRFADGELAYLTRRFDRGRGGARVAQEDFCQLLERTPDRNGRNYKYDSSYEELGQVVRRHCAAYIVEAEELFRRLICCYVLGNGDAHLKNFSLQRQVAGDYRLTPAYDLVASSMHLPTETRLALELFAEDEASEGVVTAGFETGKDFAELGRRFGIRPARVLAVLDRALSSETQVRQLLEVSFLTDVAKTGYEQLFLDRLLALSQ